MGLGADGWKCISQSHLCYWSLFLTGDLVIAVKIKKHKVAVFTTVKRELSLSAAALPLPAIGSNFSRNMIWWISLNQFSLAAHQTSVWPVPVLPSPHTGHTVCKEQSNAAASACVCVLCGSTRVKKAQTRPGEWKRSLSLWLLPLPLFILISLFIFSFFLSLSTACLVLAWRAWGSGPCQIKCGWLRGGLWLNWQEDHRLEGAHVLHIFPNK